MIARESEGAGTLVTFLMTRLSCNIPQGTQHETTGSHRKLLS